MPGEPVLASPFIAYKMDAALRRDYEATFSTAGLAKDVDLVLAEADLGGLGLPLLDGPASSWTMRCRATSATRTS